MISGMQLLIATRNRHKLDEIRVLFELPSLELVGAQAFPDLQEVEEDGATFEANAVKKAVLAARQVGLWTLADDSGLEVEALGGAPGVYSARYAGEPVNYAANNAKLLRELAGAISRAARFRCVVALSSPRGIARTVEGRCEGVIGSAARGTHGFGYDPLFIPAGHRQTFAEMEGAAKHAISHRGCALLAARAAWGDLLAAAPADWP